MCCVWLGCSGGCFKACLKYIYNNGWRAEAKTRSRLR
ncbi:unnamed protein product [Brassica rapa subsp. trilocularis]